jgi:hypothetical protein
MKFLKISNQGLLDIRLVALMGGTTKAKDQYKIGHFGTGLKYTLAWLFRNNLDFKVFVGEEQVDISIDQEEIRGENFEIICINKQRTSITTGMGLEWKAWMILREIWCNALDEGSAVKSIVTQDDLKPEPGNTVFYIQVSADIQEVLDNWDKHFINEKEEPIFQNSNYRLYSPGKHLCIYKNGVLIFENTSVRSVFRYDVLNATINELREYKMTPARDISMAIKQLDPQGIQYFLQNVTSEHYEGNNMDYNWYTQWGESWQTFMLSTKLLTASVRSRFHEGGYSYNESDYTTVPECVFKSLSESFDGLGELETQRNTHSFYEVDSPETKTKIEDCIEKLRQIGYNMEKGLVYDYGFFQDKSTMVVVKNKKFMISMGLGQKSVVDIMKQLVEENEKLKEHIEGDSNVKRHFISLYVKKLLDVSGVDLKANSPQEEDKKNLVRIMFMLTMPQKGSWDGKWTGENKLYVLIRMVSKEAAERLLDGNKVKQWDYNFGDGWVAQIDGRYIEEGESNEFTRKSAGFAGYDWMVDSLLIDGTIIPLSVRNQVPVIEAAELVEETVVLPTIDDDMPF